VLLPPQRLLPRRLQSASQRGGTSAHSPPCRLGVRGCFEPSSGRCCCCCRCCCGAVVVRGRLRRIKAYRGAPRDGNKRCDVCETCCICGGASLLNLFKGKRGDTHPPGGLLLRQVQAV
jgi:hypothetical protein